VSVALGALAAALILGSRWFLTHQLPPADRRPRLAADPIPEDVAERSTRIAIALPALRLTDPALIEKVALVSLVTIVFAEVLPGVQAGPLAVTTGVAFVIIANITLRIWLASRGRTWGSLGREFAGLAVVNTGLILLYAVLLPTQNGSINIRYALFFGLLLTLIVTLFHRDRPIHVARFEKDRWATQAQCASMS
jgi:hypothetical protein